MKDQRKRGSVFSKNIMNDYMKYDAGIQMIARKLSNGDRFLAEELRNEMHIAILNLQVGRDEGYYFRAAKNKAIDYIKSRARNYSYGNVVKHISLDAMEDAGFQIDSDGKLYAPRNRSSTDMWDCDDSE